LALRIAKPRL